MLHFVINPIAGSGLAQRVGVQLSNWLKENGREHSVWYTEGVGHATELAKNAVENGAETVVAIGGDGTVSETARGLLGAKTALGIIPAGTGNDIARTLRIPKKPQEALEFVFSHPARNMDAGYVNDMLFINVCGTGFDVCVLDYTLTAKKYVRGMLPYLWGVIRTIFTFQPAMATFQLDGGEIETRQTLLLSVANGKYFGGGIQVAPMAEPNDGYFDFVMIDHIPRWKMPFQLPKLIMGKVTQVPGFSHRRCKNITIETENMRINLDGEIVRVPNASFSVLKDALLVHY